MTIEKFRAKIVKQKLLGYDTTFDTLKLLYMEHKNITLVEDLNAEIAKLRLSHKLDLYKILFTAIVHEDIKNFSTEDVCLKYASNSEDGSLRYSLNDLVTVDEDLALLLISDYDFTKLVLNQYSSTFIDYFNKEVKIMKHLDTKLYVSGYMQNDIFIEVDSSYLIVNSKLKISFNEMPVIIKWMTLQLQRGSDFVADIIYPDGTLIIYLVENYTKEFLDVIY